ncbi:MAG: hypothetical protein N4A61_04705 [Pelagimonas sp.]|jgi:hypothetical protein|nr:hypothetical protein [Pelagimonas sp.]
MSKSSFEDRIARLQRHADTAQSVPQPEPPKRPRSPMGKLSLLLPFAFVIAGVVIGSFVIINGEQLYVSTAVQAAEDEVDGRWSVERLLLGGGDGGAGIAMKLAVRHAEDRLNDDTLTPKQRQAAKAFIESNKGKNPVDMVRQNMSGTLIFQANSLGQPDLAREIEEKMAACRSMNCLSVQQSKFSVELNRIEAARR